MKISKVTPIFQKGGRDKPKMYRPISLVPILSKAFEMVIVSQMMCLFETNNIFDGAQFAYRKGKSTVEAVKEMFNYVLVAFEEKDEVQAVLFDLTKAYDPRAREYNDPVL